MLLSVLTASIISLAIQHTPVATLLSALLRGYVSETEFGQIFNGGGFFSMIEVILVVAVSDMQNSFIIMVGLIPWAIACSAPLGFLGVGIGALKYACYMYLIPVCYAAEKTIVYRRKTKTQVMDQLYL